MQRIGRNIASLGFSRIIAGVILFVVNVQLVRYLGPDGFGQFSLVMAYYLIIFLFVDLGVSRYVIKKVSEDKSLAAFYLGNFIFTQLFLALLAFSAFLIIPRVLSYDLTITRAMLVSGIGLTLAALSIPYQSLIQAWQKLHLMAAVFLLDSLVKSGWMLAAIFLQKDVVFVFWMLIVVGAMDIFIYALLTKKIVLPRFQLDRAVVGKMFLYGIPFAAVSGFEILIQKIDVVIQKFFLPFSEVGLYSAAYRFLDFLTFLPAVVAISLFPYFAERQELDTEETKQTVNNLNRYLLTLALPLGVGSTLLGKEIIAGLFGSQFLGAVLPFQILIWATVLTLIYAVPNVLLIVKRTKTLIGVLAVVTILNVIFNIVYVPVYGIVASAWITVASYVLAAGVYIILARRLVEFRLFGYALWPIIASAVMGAVLWYWRDVNVLVLIGLAIVIYTAILLAARFLKKDDWVFVKSLWQKEEPR